MSGLFGGGPTNVAPNYTGLQIQTAVNTLPIAIVWGQSRVAPNIIWYNDFHANSGSGGKGGIFSNPYDTTYTAALIMALGEGPITGIGRIWKSQSIYDLAALGLDLIVGVTPRTPTGFVSTFYPSQALGYNGVAYVASSNYQLDSSASVDNHNFEIYGFFNGTGTNGIDADPAQIVSDFLTNPQYGVAAPAGFPAQSIDATTLFGSGGDASYQTYCRAIGLALSPALTDQEQASSILARWLQLTNTAAVWSGGELKFIPYGDTPTTAGTVIAATVLQEVEYTADYGFSQITVANAAYFDADEGVSYANGGALTYLGAFEPTSGTTPAIGTYSMSPPGTYWFSGLDGGSSVQISFKYKIAASYAPNLTPIYDLGDDDFKVEDNEDPLQVSRSDPYEAYNVWRLEVAERGNGYSLTTVEARDQNAIELYGMRIAPTVTAHEICDLNVAALSAQLMLQRAVYIRNTYKFRLSWEYCLLDPMDLVTVTDSILGLADAPIRITEIEEDDNGFLSVTAEEFPLGIATATLYPTQPVTNNPINRSTPADPVNTPIIFEPPAALAGATAQVWIAASGGSGGVADPNWGGANVWLSIDGTSYGLVGTITGPAAQGVLTAALASYSGINPDGGDTLAVNMAESAGVLASATSLDAQLASTLCIVGSELLSYTTATLTSANNYALTSLYRGLYGTAIAAHASGAPFAFLTSSAIFKYDLPAQYVGKELYLKFQSFNVFGGGVQDLSTCAAYTYTPTGVAIDHPVAQEILISGGAWDFGLASASVATADDFGGTLALAVEYDLDFGNT